MIAVFASAPRYRVAVTELARTARTSEHQRGAVCVVSGETCWDDARSALEAGAAAVVVERPRVAPKDVLFELHEVAAGRPVVVERHHLREDAVQGLVPPLRNALAVECADPSPDLLALRDALGWVRVLGSGNPIIDSSTGSGGRAIAALRIAAEAGSGGPDLPVSLVFARRGSGPTWLRATILGPDRLDVLVAATPRDPRVTLANVDGRTLVTEPRESAARRALRRAADAVAGGTRLNDLELLVTDDEVARAVVASAPRA